MGAAAQTRYEVDLHPTPEQHRILAEAAARKHRSLGSFVLDAALNAAKDVPAAKLKRSPEEITAIFKAAREAIQAANPHNRDLLEELITERREAAARGE